MAKIPTKLSPLPTTIRAAILTAAAAGGLFALPGVASAGGYNHHLRVRDRIENELLSSPEMQQALQDVADARVAYDHARQRALVSLEKLSRYRQLRAEADEVQEQLDAIYFTYRYGIPPRDTTARLAKRIFRLRQEMTEYEIKALADSKAVRQAKQALTDAGRRLTELRRDIPNQIRSDPRFQRAKGWQ